MAPRTKIKRAVRRAVWQKFNGRCAYCGAELTFQTCTVDHVFPLYRGGAEDFANYNPACRGCNKEKATFTVDEFRLEIAAQGRRFMKHVRFRIAVATGALVVSDAVPRFYFEAWTTTEDPTTCA